MHSAFLVSFTRNNSHEACHTGLLWFYTLLNIPSRMWSILFNLAINDCSNGASRCSWEDQLPLGGYALYNVYIMPVNTRILYEFLIVRLVISTIHYTMFWVCEQPDGWVCCCLVDILFLVLWYEFQRAYLCVYVWESERTREHSVLCADLKTHCTVLANIHKIFIYQYIYVGY